LPHNQIVVFSDLSNETLAYILTALDTLKIAYKTYVKDGVWHYDE
jgi:hypothetical protein